MRVTIFGSGYVGLVTGACLADAGNHVICVDVDATKIERLSRGEVPIHEPGLEALIKRNAEAGRIEFTTDAPRAIEHGLFHLIAVGDRKSTRLNSSHGYISYAVFCLKKKKLLKQYHSLLRLSHNQLHFPLQFVLFS